MATVALPGPGPRPPRSHRAKEIRRHALVYLGLLPFLLIAVFPIFWMAVTAIKQEPDLYRMDVVPFWFHLPPTWKNFDLLFHRTSFGDWMVNTMATAFWVSTITLVTATLADALFARRSLRSKPGGFHQAAAAAAAGRFRAIRARAPSHGC